MNGVEQAIFEEMLLEMRGQTALLRQFATGAGSSPQGKQPSGFNEITGSSGAVSKSFGVLGFTLGMASGVIAGTFTTALTLASSGFNSLKDVTTTLFQGQKSLAIASINGSNGLSSFYDSLSQLPGILGFAAQMFGYQAKVLEKNLITFQQVSQSGATLGGNLDLVRTSAKGMGLSMDEFANVMKANAPYLLNLGQTADSGAKALIKFNTTMINGSTGRALLGMGYGLEEANNMLGLYSATMGGVSRDQLGNQSAMEGSVKSFAEELSASAILEGKSRSQKEEEMKERSLIGARENLMSKMTTAQKQAFQQVENAALRSGGKAAADAALAYALGMGPLTKASQQYAGMFGESTQKFYQMTDTAMTATDSNAKQISRSLIATGAEADNAQNKQTEHYGNALNAMAISGKGASEISNAVLMRAGKQREAAMDSSEKIAARENAVRADVIKAQEGEAGKIAQRAAQAKYQGEEIMLMLGNLLAPLKPVLEGMVDVLKTVAPAVIGFGADLIHKIVLPLFNDLFAGISLDDVVKPFKDFFSGLFGEQKIDMSVIEKNLESVLTPIIQGLRLLFNAINWQQVGATLRTTFETLAKVAGRVLIDAINLGIGAFNVLRSTIRLVYNIFDSILAPFGGFKGILDILTPIFTGIGNVINHILMPAFDNAGNILTNFSRWIDKASDSISGPLKIAMDTLIGGAIAVGGYFGILALSQFLYNAYIMGGVLLLTAWDAVVAFATGGMALLGVAVAFLTSPIGLLIVGVGALVGLFIALYQGGFTFSTVVDQLSITFDYLVDKFKEFIDWIRGYLGTISESEKTKNAADRADHLKTREQKQKTLDDSNADTKKNRGIVDKAAMPVGKVNTIPNTVSTGGLMSWLGAPSLPAMPKAPDQKSVPKPDSTTRIEKEKAREERRQEHKEQLDKTQESTTPSDVQGASNTQDSNTDYTSQLNSGVQTMVRLLKEIDTNTGKTANLIAGHGNLFRR